MYCYIFIIKNIEINKQNNSYWSLYTYITILYFINYIFL